VWNAEVRKGAEENEGDTGQVQRMIRGHSGRPAYGFAAIVLDRTTA